LLILKGFAADISSLSGIKQRMFSVPTRKSRSTFNSKISAVWRKRSIRPVQSFVVEPRNCAMNTAKSLMTFVSDSLPCVVR
jgi:hypothetical protein